MPPPLVIAIETSNPSSWHEGLPRPGVAVATQDTGGLRVLGVEDLDTSNPQHDDLMACIDRAVRAAGATPRDVSRIAVSAGPGGFTNIRIAVTAARMIAEVTGATCVPVPSAAVVAQRVQAPGPFAVALASKGDTAFVTVFADAWKQEHAGAILSAPDLPALAAQGVRALIGDQHLPATMRDAAAAAGMAVHHPSFDPVACLEAGLMLSGVDPISLAPIYPREPEAVTKWRAMHQARSK